MEENGLGHITGLQDYIEQHGAENIQKGSVNTLINQQNYTNMANEAHGFTGVNKAIAKYNELINEGSGDTKTFLESIAETNPQLAKCMEQFNTGNMGIGNYAGSLVKATAKTVALQAATMALNGIMAAAIGVVFNAIATSIDNYVHRLDNAKTALEDSVSAWESANQEYEDASDKLQTCKDRMKELQDLSKSGKITLIEQKELDKLKESNKELKRQRALKKDELIEKQEDVLDKNRKVLSTTVVSDYKTMGDTLGEDRYKFDPIGKFLHDKLGIVNSVDASPADQTVPEELQSAFDHYYKIKNQYNKGEMSYDNFEKASSKDKKNIKKYISTINDSVEAYQKLVDAGVKLDDQEKKEFNTLKKLQDQYLIYTFVVKGTKDSYQALTTAQKKQAALEKLQEQGLSKKQANAVVGHMSKSDLNKFGDEDFDFKAPDASKYKSAEEYGKAYYQAMIDGWNKASDSSLKGLKDPTQSFEEAWGSLKDSEQKKFTTLLKNGRLTAETFNEVGDSADTLKATGLSVNTLCDNIRSFVGLQTKLENMSTAFKKVGTAYQDFKKNGYVSTSSLNSMPDAFKNLKGYSDFSKVAGNKKSSKSEIQGAFNDIVSEYIETFHILDKVTEQNKNKIITALRDAGVTNANDLIRQYERQTNENNKLLDESEKNYMKYLDAKGTSNAITDNQINKMNSELINSLGKQYQDDYNNWLEALDKKKDAYNRYVDAYNKAQPDYIYEQQQKGGASAYSLVTGAAEAQKQYEKAKKDAKKKRDKLNQDLHKIDADFSAEYTPTTSSSNSGSKKSKTKKTKQEIDWIARKLEVLQKAIDTTSGKLQNLFSIKAKKNNINKQITETTKLLNANRKAAKAYNAEANKVVIDKKNKKRDSQLKAKVRSGDYDITKYSSKTADKINKYQDLIDKAREAQDAVQDNIASIHDLNQQKLDNITTWYDKLFDRINAITSKFQTKTDLTAKIRGMLGKSETGTTTEYNNTLSSQNNALKTSRTKYNKYNAERKEQRNELIGKNKSNRQATKEFLERSGLSKKQIAKEMKKFDKKNDITKELADFDATTEAELAKLKEDVWSAMSDMLETAQALANVPMEKLNVALDNLDTKFSSLEKSANRASTQLENVGTGLDYFIKTNQGQLSIKSQEISKARKTLSETVNNRDIAQNELIKRGINPASITDSSSLESVVNALGAKGDYEGINWATKYLASISAVDEAYKKVMDVTEDYRDTVDSLAESLVSAEDKLADKNRDQDTKEHERDEKKWAYTDDSKYDRLATITANLLSDRTNYESYFTQADKRKSQAAEQAQQVWNWANFSRADGYWRSDEQKAIIQGLATWAEKAQTFDPNTDDVGDFYLSEEFQKQIAQGISEGWIHPDMATATRSSSFNATSSSRSSTYSTTRSSLIFTTAHEIDRTSSYASTGATRSSSITFSTAQQKTTSKSTTYLSTRSSMNTGGAKTYTSSANYNTVSNGTTFNVSASRIYSITIQKTSGLTSFIQSNAVLAMRMLMSTTTSSASSITLSMYTTEVTSVTRSSGYNATRSSGYNVTSSRTSGYTAGTASRSSGYNTTRSSQYDVTASRTSGYTVGTASRSSNYSTTRSSGYTANTASRASEYNTSRSSQYNITSTRTSGYTVSTASRSSGYSTTRSSQYDVTATRSSGYVANTSSRTSGYNTTRSSSYNVTATRSSQYNLTSNYTVNETASTTHVTRTSYWTSNNFNM